MSPDTALAPLKNAQKTTWELDLAHSQAEFAVRHMMITNVRGSIPIKSARIVRDDNDITKSTVEAELDAAAISTGVADRDTHLRSADFFDVENHPTIRFASTSIEQDGEELLIHGDLTMRGVARPITLRAELNGENRTPWGQEVAGIEASATLDRSQWGLNFNTALETGGVLVGEKVKLVLHLQAIKQA